MSQSSHLHVAADKVNLLVAIEAFEIEVPVFARLGPIATSFQ
jgi:hypothetical protein